MYENTTTLDSNFGDGLRLTSSDATNLRKAGKWGRFLGILSMIGIGLLLLFFVFFGGTFLALSGLGTQVGGGAAMTVFLVLYSAFFILFFYLSFLLYKFGAGAVAAVDRGDNAAVTAAFGSLARMLKIYGIIAIIYLGFFAFSLISLLVSGATAFL